MTISSLRSKFFYEDSCVPPTSVETFPVSPYNGGVKKLIILTIVVLTAAAIPTIGGVLATEDFDEAIQQKEDERDQKEDELKQSEQREYAYLQEGLSISEKLVALESDLKELRPVLSGDEQAVRSRIEGDPI